MKPGDLRRFRDRLMATGVDHFAGGTFMVLAVSHFIGTEPTRVDILLNGKCEEDLGYHWVGDSSEVISEAG